MKVIKVPTGKIIVMPSEDGYQMECLSLGDYGKEKNVKADFLGLSKDINGVPSGDCMPLSEKWVCTLSTQAGCSMRCTFCDVPKVGKGRNLSVRDMNMQLAAAIISGEAKWTKRLNIHYARMGEPTWNWSVIEHAWQLWTFVDNFIDADVVHPVLSTMLPQSNIYVAKYVKKWAEDVKNKRFGGNAGLQFSINSTSDEQRNQMFGNCSMQLNNIAKLGDELPMPKGRKYCLNFALADGYELNAKKLVNWFDKDKFMVKVTPIHKTHSTVENSIKTTDGYDYFTPYKDAEQKLKEAGFDVLVFVPSRDEDLGLITCGNAILSGSKPEVRHQTTEI